MGYVIVVNALGSAVYLKSTGTGTDVDPYIPEHSITFPTTQPVSVASFYPIAQTIASVAGNAAVTASIAGIPSVSIASAYAPMSVVASIPNVPSVSLASAYVGFNSVASVIGNAAVTASIAGVPEFVGSVNVGNFPATQNAWVGGSLNVVGNVLASIPDIPSVSVASFYPVANVVASTVGTLFAVVNTAAAGTQNSWVGGSVNVLGNVVSSTIGTLFAVVNTSAAGTSNAWVGGSVNVIGNVVSSTIGTLYAIVNTAAAGTQNSWVGGSVNVVGNVLASIPNIPTVSIVSAYAPMTVVASIPNIPTISLVSAYVGFNSVASVIGNAAMTATIAGVARVDTVASTTQPVRPSPPSVANMSFTSVIIQANGSGVVAGNLLASSTARVVVVGYQVVSTGTVILSFFDGTINAPLTGSLCLIPASGIAVPPGNIPLMMTSSGRGVTLGLSASCNVGGALQYYVPA